jgi:uncharacterized integral membrane protein
MPKRSKHKDQANHAQKREKLFDDQFDDEEVLFVFRKHPVVMRKGLVLASVVILLGTLPALVKPELSFFFGGLAVGFFLSFVVFFPSWIAWYYSIFIVTDKRLIQIARKGLFHKTVVDMNLTQIQSMNYQISGIQETLLKFGTIMIQTYMGDLVIHDVHHPEKVQKTIASILREQGISTAALSPEQMEQMAKTGE